VILFPSHSFILQVNPMMLKFRTFVLIHVHGFQYSRRLTKYQHCNAAATWLLAKKTAPISVFASSVNTSLIRPIHSSANVYKTKGKKDKGSKKIQQLIRPVDAAHVLDLNQVQTVMKEKVEELKIDYAKEFRIGANIPLEQIEVVIEGDTYALNEVAQISKPSPRLVQVDMISFPEFVKVAEMAIRESKWNLNPSITGTIIKVPIPQATAEHRNTVAKNAKQRLGVCKKDLQNIVQDIELDLKQHKSESEDLIRILKQQVKIFYEHYTDEVDILFKGKEKEILHPS